MSSDSGTVQYPSMHLYWRARGCLDFFGQVVKGLQLLSSWANRGALLWEISNWSEIFFKFWSNERPSVLKGVKKKREEEEEKKKINTTQKRGTTNKTRKFIKKD